VSATTGRRAMWRALYGIYIVNWNCMVVRCFIEAALENS